MYADFNFSHGLAFVGASATTACANVTDLEYGFVHGDADEQQGSLDTVIREEGEKVISTNVKTSTLGELEHTLAGNVSPGVDGRTQPWRQPPFTYLACADDITRFWADTSCGRLI